MQNKAVHLNNDISSRKSLLEFYLKLTFCRWVKLTTQFVGGWSDGRSRNRRIVWQFHDGVMYYTDTHSRGMSRTCGRVDGSRSSGFPTRANTWSLPLLRARAMLSSSSSTFHCDIYEHGKGVDWMPSSLGFEEFLDEKPCTDPNGILLSLAGSISAVREAHSFVQHSHHKPVNAFCQIFPRRSLARFSARGSRVDRVLNKIDGCMEIEAFNQLPRIVSFGACSYYPNCYSLYELFYMQLDGKSWDGINNLFFCMKEICKYMLG